VQRTVFVQRGYCRSYAPHKPSIRLETVQNLGGDYPAFRSGPHVPSRRREVSPRERPGGRPGGIRSKRCQTPKPDSCCQADRTLTTVQVTRRRWVSGRRSDTLGRQHLTACGPLRNVLDYGDNLVAGPGNH
jgi:hypothetical protein